MPLVLAATLFLAGCPTIDDGDPPITPGTCQPDFAQFRDQVWPTVFAAPSGSNPSCVGAGGCHRQSDGRSALRLIEMPTTDSEHMQNYEVVTRFLNCTTPDASSVITKPLANVDGHGGGDLWNAVTDPQPACVESWIENQPCM